MSFYPSLVVDLTLRFDEALTIVPDVPLITTTAAALDAALDPALTAQLNAAHRQRQRADLLILQRGDKNASHITSRVPKSASVELPGYRQAGTFNLVFDYRELPIDPRTVRSAAVDVHIGTVKASSFGKGMARANQDGSRESVMRTVAPSGFNPGTLRLRGIVDDWEVEHGETGSEVTISGRDMRGLLLDTPVGATDPKAAQFVVENLDLSKPVDDVVRQLLSYNPMFSGFNPVVDPKEWEGGVIPAPGAAYAAPRHRRGATGQRKGALGTPPGGSGNQAVGNVNFWDMIVRVCYLVGAIPYFVGPQLVIRPARGIYAQEAAQEGGLVPIPFKGSKPREKDAANNLPIAGGPLRIRRMVYGRDVASLSFKRQLGGYQRPHTVRVVAVDGSSTARGKDRQLEARWPAVDKAKAKVDRVAPGGQVKTEEFTNVPVSGVTDPQQLLAIAKGIYEEIGRGELGGSVSTKNLASFGGDNDDPDLLRLGPGDAVELRADTRGVRTSPPLVSTYTDAQRRSFESAVAETQRILGGDVNLARVIVATARGQVTELQTVFRVGSVHYSWAAASGLKVDFDFMNYVEVRADVG